MRFQTSLHQAMRSTGYAVPFILRWWVVIGVFRSSLFRSCSLSGPLLYHSPVVFFDRGHTRFGNFNSTIPVDVIRVKSYVDSFLDPTGVPVRVSINKLYRVPTEVDNGRSCGHVQKRRRSGYGRVVFPCRAL